jgi:hypothetical protein
LLFPRRVRACGMALVLEHIEDLARPDQMELLAGDPLELVVVLAKGVEAASRFVVLLNQIEALALHLAELAPQLDDAGDPAIAPQSRGEEPDAGPREQDCHPVAACELEQVGHSLPLSRHCQRCKSSLLPKTKFSEMGIPHLRAGGSGKMLGHTGAGL